MYDYKSQDVFDFANSIGADTIQKGDELFFRYCPRCHGDGHDKNTFSINLTSGAFKCFRSSCNYHGHFVELARDFDYQLDDGGTKHYKKLPQRKFEPRPKALEYLAKRGISAEIANKYSLTNRKDNENILVFPFYDENGVLQFIKYRNMAFNGHGNKEWCEKDTKPILFGMAQCEDFTQLVITEGQIDSLSVAQAGIKNAVSVPTGALGFTWMANCWDWINKFESIVVFGDNEKGHITLIDTLEKRIPGKVRCVSETDYLHCKDANEILVQFGVESIKRAVEDAQRRDVRFVKRLADVQSVNLKDLPKIKTGVYELDRAIGGLLLGHVYLLSGKRGEGKSTFMSQIVADALNQGMGTFVYSGELPNYHFKNWLDMQIAGQNHIKTAINDFGDEEYYLDEAVTAQINKWYYDKAFIFDNSAITDDEFEGLLATISEAICRYDIKLVCIDNLMTAMDGDPSSDIYRQQSQFVKSLEKMAQQYDVAIILVAHPKKRMQRLTTTRFPALRILPMPFPMC
jgi:Replicative DNA helicase